VTPAVPAFVWDLVALIGLAALVLGLLAAQMGRRR
jgi:hypothetical protein